MTIQFTEEHLTTITETKSRAESNTKRLNEHDKKFREMEKNYELLKDMSLSVRAVAEQTSETATMVANLQTEVNKMREEEIARKAVEEDRNRRKSEFRNAFSGKLLYKILEYVIVAIVVFVIGAVIFYIKSQL